ncbi:M1 family metallopeptidase [Gramella sp. AN32]|uniref:M1 family metallopeptidase n=1 Tax=Christiangramia antarctica TaxID=2058158 RepID=A0ABW5X0L4_9FLAO|nr:M1 family metallopeptidase [Gramella sp. AN32]MCM4154989.1 peptidase M1 [Gramella sp. AN32]
MRRVILSFLLISVGLVSAQNNTSYWQQEVDYKMNVDMNVETFKYTGDQELEYVNNSPDTLNRVFYHLFFNAFQPGSEMNARLESIADPDGRMVTNSGTRENPDFKSRITPLTKEHQGYLHVKSLTQDGKEVKMEEVGTVLEVELAEALLPGDKTTFKMSFEGQVPDQVRRSGRNSSEGVALSMSQWYPKLAEYDFQGWHADPYIAREFYGVWGDFDVKISIDKNYILGSTGYLQNADEIGFGYEKEGTKVKKAKGDKLTWHFKAPMVHDFTWAADPEYIHDKLTASDGTVLHFLYKDNNSIKDNWKALQPKTAELLEFYNVHIGPYPWDQYSVIQGGDGGMEYAMLTLITGERSLGSLIGVTAHEMAHAWFQHLMGTNESYHEWMDEGFTSYISDLAMDEVMGTNKENPNDGNYRGYRYLANSGKEQPQTTHADRYVMNGLYGASAYSKGAVFLAQLGYVIGEENLAKTLNRYYDEWKFKHPTPNDFIRIAEKVSGAELDWYLMDWTQTTNTIDYGVKAVEKTGDSTQVILERIGLMPMPIDVTVAYADGTSEDFYIPLEMMRWNKETAAKTLKDWAWGFPTYTFAVNKDVSAVQIDKSGRMADVAMDNNNWQANAAETSEDSEN